MMTAQPSQTSPDSTTLIQHHVRRRSSNASISAADQKTGEAAVRDSNYHGQMQQSQTSPVSLLKIAVAFIVILSIASTLIDRPKATISEAGYHYTPPDRPAEVDSFDLLPDLAIRLHPEQHVKRAPRIQHLCWSITRDFRRPDGVSKPIYLVNGAFPGPLVEVRSGDTLIVEVHNDLKSEISASKPSSSQTSDNVTGHAVNPVDLDLAIHMHGLRLRGANRMDGAIGITQPSIKPGCNFTYEIPIGDDEQGTFWWHAHSGVMRGDGAFGGLVVHRPLQARDDGDIRADLQLSYASRYDPTSALQATKEGLLLIGDWYHRPANDVLGWYMRSGSFGNEPVPDSILVNGQGHYDCDMAVPARPMDCVERAHWTRDLGQTTEKNASHMDVDTMVPPLLVPANEDYKLRIVNTGSMAGFSVSFTDVQMLEVIAVDGGHSVTSSTNRTSVEGVGILYPGERVDIMLRINSDSVARTSRGAGQICVDLDEESFRYPNPALATRHCYPVRLVDNRKKTDVQVVQRDVHGEGSATPPVRKPENGTLISLQDMVSSSTYDLRAKADQTLLLYTTTLKLAKLSNIPHGYINHTSWKPSAVPLIDSDREAWDENQFAPHIGKALISQAAGAHPFRAIHEPKWIDIVINNLDDGGHPFHLHGYSFYVLSVAGGDFTQNYWGSYNPFELADGETPPGGAYNLHNPVVRDTVFVPRRGYAVIRVRADNPGIWMLHCHVMWHLGSGMAMALEIE